MTPKQLIVVMSFVLLAMTACTTGPRAPSPTVARSVTTTVPATTTTTISVEEATSMFHDCLADRGIGLEAIPFDSQGRPRLELVMAGVDFGDPAAVDALTECSDLLANGALDLSVWPQLQAQVQQTLEMFSECVRSHGVLTFPDPVRPFLGVGGPFPLEQIPFDDPDLESAVDICGSRVLEEGQ